MRLQARLTAAAAIWALAGLAACEATNEIDEPELIGAGAGAVGGAIVGEAVADEPLIGAGIGAAAGGIGGHIYDRNN